jgi:hypothetical protein
MNNTSPLLYINQELLEVVETEDVSWLLREEFKFDEEVYEDMQINHPKGYSNNDSEPIHVNHILNLLNAMKNRGCTHVSIDWHCDHQTYEVEGYRITEAPVNIAADLLAKKLLKENKDHLKSIAYKEYQEKVKQIENLT